MASKNIFYEIRLFFQIFMDFFVFSGDFSNINPIV